MCVFLLLYVNYTSVKLLLFSTSHNFVPNFTLLYSLFHSSETQTTLGVKGSEDSSCKPIFSSLPETNILNVVKVGENSFLYVFSTELEPLSFLLNGFKTKSGTSLVVQWLRLHAPNAGGPGSILVRELDPRVPH